ncbi:unnamed protein product [Heterosigma akashiwo]
MVRSFAENQVEPQAFEYNKEEKFNLGLFRQLGELGLLGITADPEYGGSGMDATAAAIVHEELSAVDPAFCLSYLAHSMLFVNNLDKNGTPAQRARFLPAACAGAAVGGMGMSEPGAGTDALGMTTTAELSSCGTYYTLNGTKMWITNGTLDGKELGDIYLVYARTGKNPKDLSLFVVEKGAPGFHLGQKIGDKLGMRASMTAELVFEDARWGGGGGGGGGGGNLSLTDLRNMIIEQKRLIDALCSMASRSKQMWLLNLLQAERKAFGKPINSFGQIQKAIAETYAEYMAGRSHYLYQVCHGLDLASHGNGLDADGVKLFCGPVGKNAADRAIQVVLGGYGYVGEYAVERLWRDAKLLEIGGGTNEAHHKNMVRDLKQMEKLH